MSKDNNNNTQHRQNPEKKPADQHIDERVKYFILVAIILVVIAVVCIVLFTKPTTNNNKPISDNNVQATEEVTVTPTLMYFVTKNDTNYSDYMTVIEELQNEYNSKINFDVRDVDEHPEEKDNFPINDNTPLLIMLNTHNDIIAIDTAADRTKIEGYINSALSE